MKKISLDKYITKYIEKENVKVKSQKVRIVCEKNKF